jgi:hypothetical protein
MKRRRYMPICENWEKAVEAVIDSNGLYIEAKKPMKREAKIQGILILLISPPSTNVRK